VELHQQPEPRNLVRRSDNGMRTPVRSRCGVICILSTGEHQIPMCWQNLATDMFYVSVQPVKLSSLSFCQAIISLGQLRHIEVHL